MDIEQKKQEVKIEIADQPSNVVFARIDICDEIQLADLMKVQFTTYFRGAANASHSNSDTLPDVCHKLAQQRALLHGASVSGIMKFNIAPGAAYTSTGSLTFPQFEDSSYDNKTTFPFIVIHDFTDAGGILTLSTTTNANTTITNDDGTTTKYFTDFSKYFLSRSRANGEMISADSNTAPYMGPTSAKPFLPSNTVNGITFTGVVDDPTANSDVRYEYTMVANTVDAVAGGHIGGGYDLAEDLYTGNTYVWTELSNVTGTFSATEELKDFEGNASTVKSSANTSTVLLEVFDTVGTFVTGELLTDRGTNASVFSTKTSGKDVNITLTGSSFDTGSNTSITLGYPVSETITLDTNSVSRTGSSVSIQTTKEHGILSGERIVLKGADDVFGEFNGIFEVGDTTSNTLNFTTANTISVVPTGNFSLVKNVVFGRTSNASAAVRLRTVNATANVVFQSADLAVGFAVGNTVSGGTSGATGTIDSRTTQGEWYQSRDNAVKVFNTGTGTWTIDTAANTGEFWNKEFEPVRISTIIPTSGTGSSTVAPKMKLTKAIATSGDTSGGYDATTTTRMPGTYFSYPLKTWEAQVHGGVTTLEAHDNFARVIIAPEGLEVNFDWLPLSQNAAGNKTGADISQNGSVANNVHIPEKSTSLSKTEFKGKLGPYNMTMEPLASFNPPDDVFRSCHPDLRSNAMKVGTSGAVYPSVNANPFFPAVGATHKPIANTDNNVTGRQPGNLDANAAFAGSFSEYQKGALEPPAADTDPSQNFRYAIQNDQKWIYASPSGIAHNTPNAADQKDVMFSNAATATAINNSATETADNAGASNASTLVTIPANVAGSCTTLGHAGYPSGTAQTQTTMSISSAGGRANMILRNLQTCTPDADSCSDGSDKTQSECTAASGTWAPQGQSFVGTAAEFPCLFNRVQYVMTSNGNALSVGATTNMEASFAVFYQLILNLISASYGKNYTDPVQRTEAGSYSEVGRSDASFKTMVETMKSRVDAVIPLHNTERAAVTSNIGSAYSHPSAYKTAYDSMISYLGTFKSGVQYRIREISNRIGYLNGKNTAFGGGAVNGDVTVGAAGAGFAGYTFNGGSGYANTIYSHANFLAGKKINLLGNILTAISDVDGVYDQITAKRSEYYEYNQ